ncbi:hypothetical protein V6Z11_D05G366300 [Gossypium hirsutum]
MFWVGLDFAFERSRFNLVNALMNIEAKKKGLNY